MKLEIEFVEDTRMESKLSKAFLKRLKDLFKEAGIFISITEIVEEENTPGSSVRT